MSIGVRRIQKSSGVNHDGVHYDANGRPSGPGYVRYEDLYQSGDTVTVALSRLSMPAIVTFPEGEFWLNGFPYYGGAINCDKNLVRGIIGSGRGTLGGTAGTIFKMVPNSSTFITGTSPETPSQAQGGSTQVWMIRCVGAVASTVRFENFQLLGAAEGHNYSGLYVYHPTGDVIVRNILVCGVEGNHGAPPGETFAILSYQGNLGKTLIENCEVDGRRVVGGEWFTAAGITTGQSIGAIIRGCNVHHCRVSSGIVFYRAFDGRLENCNLGTTDPIQSSLSYIPSEVNHEVCDNIVHVDCTYTHCATNQGVHVSFSNNHTVCQYAAWPPRSCVDGKLTVINPTWNNIWGDNYLYIESWKTGVDGTSNDDSMVTPPLVVQSNGTTHVPYKWAHGTNQLIA